MLEMVERAERGGGITASCTPFLLEISAKQGKQ